MLRASSPPAPATEIDRPTEFHLARQNQNLLQPDTPVELIAVMDEASLRREVGSHNVLRAQLERLLLHSESPSVTVQILPFDKGAHGALNGSFTILEFPDPSDPSWPTSTAPPETSTCRSRRT
ncbi:Scr1 family TA system antitoxin-like transcriptional regulator [Streptomyces sp. NPDC059477]|uniref:Scr1 family TA system antitoxin-like transcriptional regulator n=1 Tax=Streptomyces sp. NPDC059477 TaxID=3346847 RepID=UPI0036C7A687